MKGVPGWENVLTGQSVVDFLQRLGDPASVGDLFLSVVGFALTFYGVFKAKSAAQSAERAAKSTRDSIRLMDTVVDFAAAISTLEEIKRLQRAGQWLVLPDRYASLRKTLVTLRASNRRLTPGQLAAIQNSLVNLYELEATVERSLSDPSGLKAAKFNAVISKDIDVLIAALEELKAAEIGASQ
jgi:hypothetical protein